MNECVSERVSERVSVCISYFSIGCYTIPPPRKYKPFHIMTLTRVWVRTGSTDELHIKWSTYSSRVGLSTVSQVNFPLFTVIASSPSID